MIELIWASHIEIEEVEIGKVIDNAISEQKPKGDKVMNLKESFSKREH